jgi:glucose/arabinose dehydrogenase
VPLLDNMFVDPQGRHSGCDLAFGKDGFLYMTVGDGYCDYAGNSGCAGLNDAARDKHVVLGKILRITRGGAVPPGNPFASTGGRCNTTGRTTQGPHCQETFAWGLRNPFRFAFDPNATGTRFFVNDTGQNHWEEINEGQAGADFGWNLREGHCARGS